MHLGVATHEELGTAPNQDVMRMPSDAPGEFLEHPSYLSTLPLFKMGQTTHIRINIGTARYPPANLTRETKSTGFHNSIIFLPQKEG